MRHAPQGAGASGPVPGGRRMVTPRVRRATQEVRRPWHREQSPHSQIPIEPPWTLTYGGDATPS